MATLKHINSKSADYGAAEQYLLFEHDEFTMKPVLDETGRLIPREDYRLSTLNCGGEDFAVACMRANLRYGKNQQREDVKSHHYIISFDPRDGPDNGLTVDRAQALGEKFCAEHFPGHQALVCTHPDGHNHSGNIHVHIVINSLRIEEVPFLPYMDRPADTKADCKHRCTDAALRYFKSEVMEMCHREGLYQIDLLNGSKNRVTDREYWAQKKGQAALDRQNAPMIAGGITPRQTKFETNKEKLRQTIRAALSAAASFEDFSSLLLREGVTVKESRGRLSYLTPDRTKPITARKLGDDFDRAAVLAVLEQNAARATEKATAIPEYPRQGKPGIQPTKTQKTAPKQDGVQRLVDIEKKLAEGKGRGYEHWATMHNLKQMAATLNVYQEYGFTSPEQLEAAVDTAYQEMRQTSGELKALETKLKEKYHHVRLTVGGVEAVSEKIVSPEDAQAVQAACAGNTAVCTSATREQKKEQPPKLYDLTTLQREANRMFGYTAKQTLDCAQSLYEKKLLTYPRTDSRYLTSDMAETASCILHLAAKVPPFDGCADFFPDVEALISDQDVSDHHAIIPTMEMEKADVGALPVGERNLFLLICCKLLCAAAEPHVYETVTAVFDCGGHSFTAKGKHVVSGGWREIDRIFRSFLKEKPADGDGGGSLPDVKEGQTFEGVEAAVTEHFTSPPKPYTEDTLLSAMENAGKEDIPDEAERKGLGTPATRAAIIEKLVAAGFVERKGKNLIPTKDGINLVTVLPEPLTSPMLTAEWEQKLTEVAKGSADPGGFLDGIRDMVRELVQTYSHISEEGQKLFAPEKEVIGTCPRCGRPVYEGKKNFSCSDRSCGFVLWKNDHFWTSRKKELTKKMAADLLKKGRTNVKGMWSEKKGSTYDAAVILNDTGGKYINFKLEFSKRKAGGNGR